MNNIIGSGNCDYTDIIMPIDYVPQAFEYANRKLFHKWKMIGMQVSHTTVGGIMTDDPEGWGDSFFGRTSGLYSAGIASGCHVIEEVNQNNQLIGRGSYYFRAKSDAPEMSGAAYGIMGQCNTPGIEHGIWNMEDGQNSAPGYAIINDYDYASPMRRGWGRSMGNDLCSCGGAGGGAWTMGVFVENLNAKPVHPGDNIYLMYMLDAKCNPGEDADVCAARDSRMPGRFRSWVDKHEFTPYRTCEANFQMGYLGGLGGDGGSPKCFVARAINDDNGIVDPKFHQSPWVTQEQFAGLSIKLTSLPTCNHFEKNYTIPSRVKATMPGDPLAMPMGYRCERGVLRIAPVCYTTVAGPIIGNVVVRKTHFFDIIEKHYDRWDKADDFYVGCYKLFDESFYIPSLNWNIRVVSHKKTFFEKWSKARDEWAIQPPLFDESPYKWVDAMKKQWVTGGSIFDKPGAKRGCSCSHSGNINHYPIRPYNEFRYCPNDFTCDKTCT